MVLMGSKFPFTHCNRPAYYEYIIASMYSMLSLYLGILFSFHKSSTVQQNTLTKGGFFSESAIRFLDLQILKKKYSKKTILSLKFKIQAQDSFLEYFFWDLEIWKNFIALSEKKPPLTKMSKFAVQTKMPTFECDKQLWQSTIRKITVIVQD